MNIILLTGLPAVGKTTIARSIVDTRSNVALVDGDALREARDLGFTKKDRLEQLRRATSLAINIANTGVNVVCALIAPYQEGRSDMEESVRNAGHHFHMVYLYCPIDHLIERDPKGMWKKARSGEIKNFTGWDDPYEIPDYEDTAIRIDTNAIDIKYSHMMIAGLLND